MGLAEPTSNGNGHGRFLGRFVKGNPGGPGNPYAARVARLKNAALVAVEPDVYAGIIRKMAELALKGDVSAAVFVRDTLVGKPTPLPVPDGEEGMSEIEKFLEIITEPELHDRIVGALLARGNGHAKENGGPQ